MLTTFLVIDSHVCLVSTILESEDYRTFLSWQKVLLDSTVLDNLE